MFGRRVMMAAAAAVFGSVFSLQAGVIGKSTKGPVELKSIDVIEFADDGTLLIGDGKGTQIVAVATKEGDQSAAPTAKIEDLPGKVAERLGAGTNGVEILDLAIHPHSHRLFLAVRRQQDKSHAIVTVDQAGAINLFPLDQATHAAVKLSTKASISKVTDLVWADERLVAAAGANEEFSSKLFVIPGPINHQAVGTLHSVETYHVQHRKWETKAPMSVIMPYKEAGKTYVVGAFACTPVVKYPLDALATPDAQVKGMSMIELGSGNRPLDMFGYEKGGKQYILASTFRMHHERKPFGPSPYWTVKFEQGLLGEKDKVNENASLRLSSGFEPINDRITVVESFHGVMQMAKLGDAKAIALRAVNADAKGNPQRIDLEVLALP